MNLLNKLLISLLLFNLTAYNAEVEIKNRDESELTKHNTIELYKKERDNKFISDILDKDPHNFPDASKVSDLDSENVEMVIPQLNGQNKIYNFRQKIFVCCFDSKPIGFVRVFDLLNGIGQIAQIAVVESARRRGIGKLLLIHGIDFLKSSKIKMITLETMSDNLAAHALYEKIGFKKLVGTGSHYLYCLQFDI